MGQPLTEFTQAEFDLIVARAELAGALDCAEVSGGPSARERVEADVAETVAGFRACRGSDSDKVDYYQRRFLELAQGYWIATVRTLIEYAHAGVVWEGCPDSLPVGQIEAYADGLAGSLEKILRMLDFDPPLASLVPDGPDQ
jgi:hypothetical protein